MTLFLTNPLLIITPLVPITLKKISRSASAFGGKTVNKINNINIKIKEEASIAAASI